MKKEIWVPAIYIQKTGKKIDFTGLYEVSNFGNCRTLKKRKGIMATFQEPKRGYLKVNLLKDDVPYSVYLHRLVLCSFNPDGWFPSAQVNHKNEIKTDNRLENLEWCTQVYNMNFGTRKDRQIATQYNGKKSIPVIQDDLTEWISATEAGRVLGICESNIVKCLTGSRKTAGGSTWKYK